MTVLKSSLDNIRKLLDEAEKQVPELNEIQELNETINVDRKDRKIAYYHDENGQVCFMEAEPELKKKINQIKTSKNLEDESKQTQELIEKRKKAEELNVMRNQFYEAMDSLASEVKLNKPEINILDPNIKVEELDGDSQSEVENLLKKSNKTSNKVLSRDDNFSTLESLLLEKIKYSNIGLLDRLEDLITKYTSEFLVANRKLIMARKAYNECLEELSKASSAEIVNEFEKTQLDTKNLKEVYDEWFKELYPLPQTPAKVKKFPPITKREDSLFKNSKK
jgi:hypothetical protein